MIIKYKKLDSSISDLQYAYSGDAGLDICAAENTTLTPLQPVLINTGIKMDFPSGYVALIWDKSSLAFLGIHVLGGVIDSNYRGEIKVVLINLTNKKINIQKRQKIAQILLQKVEKMEMIEVEKLNLSSREDKGFGSSGK
ncbi:MAG TPA: dUTP diphosphatase [Candidatus Portnoybacteria bacterium]|nr:dUTP diphosphatase [Candidatus Portnoybacteria bacterium]